MTVEASSLCCLLAPFAFCFKGQGSVADAGCIFAGTEEQQAGAAALERHLASVSKLLDESHAIMHKTTELFPAAKEAGFYWIPHLSEHEVNTLLLHRNYLSPLSKLGLCFDQALPFW